MPSLTQVLILPCFYHYTGFATLVIFLGNHARGICRHTKTVRSLPGTDSRMD
jgi:hypothetical protein